MYFQEPRQAHIVQKRTIKMHDKNERQKRTIKTQDKKRTAKSDMYTDRKRDPRNRIKLFWWKSFSFGHKLGH